MLSGFQTFALGEWLRAADAHGWGVPPEHLPALADYARNRAEYRPLVIAAAGRRASWLADLNPEWRFLHEAVAESNDPRVWTHGNAIQRRSWLRAARHQDPAAAREALEEVWPTESAADPGRFPRPARGQARRYRTRSSSRPRSTTVPRRYAGSAARLLARLPGSQYGERMAERVWAHLLLSQGVLAVDLSAQADASMERDGIDPQNRRKESASGLGGSARSSPPRPCRQWNHLARDTRRRVCARGAAVAWTEAAVRESSVEWARALLQAGCEYRQRGPAELLRLLPADEWASAVDSAAEERGRCRAGRRVAGAVAGSARRA